MKFAPKTEKELNEANNIPNGDHAYEVLTATDKTSAAGNDMIELQLRIFVGDTSRMLTDFLLESFGHKLLHFCSLNGLNKEYAEGRLTAEHCLGKTGYLTIGTSKGKPKNDGTGDFWPDRSNVKDYIRAPMKKAGVLATETEEEDPFFPKS